MFTLYLSAALPGFIGSLWELQQVALPLVISFAVIVRAVLYQHAP